MLKQSHRLAADHGVRLFMLQQHPDHRGLGNEGLDLGHHGQISRVTHHILGKARSVIVEYPHNALLHLRRRPGGSKNRQISTLGVSAQPQRAGIRQGHIPGILQRQPLGGDGLLEGHIEILLPAHQGTVRPPECQKQAAVIQAERHGSELGLLLRAELVTVHPDLALSEANGLHGSAKQNQVILHSGSGFIVLSGEQVLPCLLQRQGGVRLRFRLSGVMDIGKSRKNQCVHRIQRSLGEGQVPSPLDVIHDVCHE